MSLTRYLWIFFLCVFAFASSCKHKKDVVASKKKTRSQTVAKHTDPSESKAGNVSNSVLQQKLGITEKEIKANKLFLFINDWYGVPYKYGGCQKTGIDCSCFTNLLCEKVYSRKLGRSANDMYNECVKVPIEEAKEGDLIFFKINGNTVSHVGVYLRNKLFVHASTSKGVIINSMDEAYYKKCFHSGGRIKNI